MQDWSRRIGQRGAGARRRVVYGSTELINAESFVNSEPKQLGEEG